MSDVEPVDLGRRSSVMAAGTVLSRATGFARLLALGYAIGFNHLSDAYNLANTLPNIVYELVLGGVVSATLIPLFVGLFDHDDAADDDAAWHAVNAVTTIVIAVTAGVSIVFALVAPLLAAPYAALNHTPQAGAQLALTVSLMRFFAPQVVLLAGMAVGSAVLNARRRFAAANVAPVLNNLVAIAALVIAAHYINSDQRESLHLGIGLVLLGVGTTLGYVAQLVGIVPSLLRIGARFRVVWEPRHATVRAAARLSGWTIGFVVANQLAFLVVIALANRRGGDFSAYQAAYGFFILPHSVIAVSVTGALLPELSLAASRADHLAFRALLARGLRVIGVLLVPAAIVGAVFARPLLQPLLAHGQLTAASVRQTGAALAAFALGIPGFSAFLLCTRALQAQRDARRVFYLYVLENGLNVGFAVALYHPMGVRGLALAFSIAYTIGAIASYVVVIRRSPIDPGAPRLPFAAPSGPSNRPQL